MFALILFLYWNSALFIYIANLSSYGKYLPSSYFFFRNNNKNSLTCACIPLYVSYLIVFKCCWIQANKGFFIQKLWGHRENVWKVLEVLTDPLKYIDGSPQIGLNNPQMWMMSILVICWTDWTPRALGRTQLVTVLDLELQPSVAGSCSYFWAYRCCWCIWAKDSVLWFWLSHFNFTGISCHLHSKLLTNPHLLVNVLSGRNDLSAVQPFLLITIFLKRSLDILYHCAAVLGSAPKSGGPFKIWRTAECIRMWMRNMFSCEGQLNMF